MTDIITVDWETFYDDEVGFKKLTTEEYIRHPDFEEIGVAIKINNGPTEWASGTHGQLQGYLREFDWGNSLMLAHNTKFDGAIMNWRFGIRPKGYLDTLSMARAIHGTEVGGSLAALTDRYGLGKKGTEVVNAFGKRRRDFTDAELAKYGDYCINDVELCYKLFCKMVGFPKKELKLIDLTLRMFIEPVLELEEDLLLDHLKRIQERNDDLLVACGFTERSELMSNPKFATALQKLGVVPPTKVSLRTGKTTWAFSKNDAKFMELLEHEDTQVQTLMSARLGLKSTLEESRTERFIGISRRGLMPVPIRYYAAHTGRWGGDEKINLQNLPARGIDAKTLKRSIKAQEGYVLIDSDSSQIEARVLAWLAGEHTLTQAFRDKEDVYIQMASSIYGVPHNEVTKAQRFVGKTTILGCGYGMGAVRFQEQLQNFGVAVELEEAQRIVRIYRETNKAIVNLWDRAGTALRAMLKNASMDIDYQGILKLIPEENAVRLPSGLLLRYDDLQAEDSPKGPQFTYKTRYGRSRIYGGKCVENWVQAIARCIVGEQMLLINKRYRPILTVHDSVVTTVPMGVVKEAKLYVEQCMRYVPEWATGLPVDCEAFAAVRYGDCEEKNPNLVAA